MGKKNKSVPECEALRYKGTLEKPDIKIFVSHRIDKDSETIDNPLYIPVRCGAIFDKRENNTILGDDTGDNISEKRKSFCELTVQYWAWKNVDADYYGLCHYRRYLSFSDKKYENIDAHNHVIEKVFGDDFIEKYGLSEKKMRKEIVKYDVVSLIPTELDKLETEKNTVYESLKNNPSVFPTKYLDLFIKIFKKKYPDYINDIDEYFDSYTWRAFNCYILKKEYFNEYNEMLFNVLFELEEQLDSTYCNQEQQRFPGYMGEVMFGVYYKHLQRLKNVKTIEKQLVRVEYPEKKKNITPYFVSENVPIVMASSNEYVPFLAVLLQSIIDNSSDKRNYDIIIISSCIRNHNKDILQNMLGDRSNFSIRFIEAERYLTGRSFYTAMHVTTMTYLRLAMLDILQYYDKAIYLDCDVVVNADIGELYDIDLSGHLIGAAIDTVMSGWCNMKGHQQIYYNEKVIGLKNKFEYFNAGIIVVNLKEFREFYTTEKLLDMAASRKWKWFDQDVLNKVCEGKTKFISNQWNVMVHWHDLEWQLTEYFAPNYIYEEYKIALENPKAIHFAGRSIPCFVPCVDLAEFFWKYARKTPYYEIILGAMIDNKNAILINSQIDTRTGARKIADKVLPKGTRRREFAKLLLPKDSLRWRFCKQIYYIFKPQYRPQKENEEDDI